jgi:thioredoxin-dependent peroxiredoxin
MARASIKVGDKAPMITLNDQAGSPVSLADLIKENVVVLYFYPKDETPGCTAEACSFRDSYDVFAQAGAQVVGVSADSTESHASFARHHGLPFVLLSDPDGSARAAFGVNAVLGLLPGRVTFVIDRQGVVRHHFSSSVRIGTHVEGALAMVKELAASG